MANKADFSDNMEPVVEAAEARMRDASFDLETAKRFVCDLQDMTSCHKEQGHQDADMEKMLLGRVSGTAHQFLEELKQGVEAYNPHQLHLYLLCALSVFPASVQLAKEEGRLAYKFTQGAQNCFNQLEEIRIYCQSRKTSQRSDRILNFRILLMFGAWLERQRTHMACLTHSKLFFFVRPLTDMLHYIRLPGIPQVDTTDLRIISYSAGIQTTYCLIREGYLEEAKQLFEGLPRVNRSNLQRPASLSVRHGYVTACIWHHSGEHIKALSRAQEALRESQDADERTEIEDLIRRIESSVTETQEDDHGPPDENWLEGTHAHSVELFASQQNTARQMHHPKPKRRRPRRSASESRDQCQSPSSHTQQPHLNRVRTTSLRRCPSPDFSQYSGSPQGACSSGHLESEKEDADFRKLLLSKKFEEDSDDEDYEESDGSVGVIGFEDEEFDQDTEDVPGITPYPNTDEHEEDDHEDWFTKSDSDSNESAAFADSGDITYISDEQLEAFQRNLKGRLFYEDLNRDTVRLKKFLNEEPCRYKRCRLKIESSHRSIATVLDANSNKFSEILISGRSKCGQTFTDDEVVVEVLAEPGQIKTETSVSKPSTNSTERMAHGKVVGLLHRVNHPDEYHTVLVCTLDEFEGHLMKPLCQTVPKIHVLNDTVRERFPSLTKHKIEIKEISPDGCVEHKGFVNVRPDKRGQYVFAVVFLTWSQKNIYPLGAVVGWQLTGTGCTGAELVLSMKHKVPRTYPQGVVSATKDLLHTTAADAEDRENITNKRVFTIDPPGSKDLDDALSVWKEGTHHVVGVHIADVAAVVKEGSPVDEEARRRAVTFYPLLRKPHHMLPEPLSQDMFSLLPNTERQTISVFYRFNDRLKMIGEPEVKRTVIHSEKQLTYDQVQEVINGKPPAGVDEVFCSDILLLNKIASKLREDRYKTSMLYVPFDDPRLVDPDKLQDTKDACALVEEFMVLTNSYIAKRLRTKFPRLMILRCHKAPTYEQRTKWSDYEGGVANLTMKLQGKNITPETKLSFDRPNAGSQYQQQNVIVQSDIWKRLERHLENEEVEEACRIAFMDDLHPLQCLAINHWMDLMETAQYKCSYGLNPPDHVHFDMDLDCYTHFTSPIRRYADLHVQRLLHADLDGEAPSSTPDDVIRLCHHINSATARQKAFGKGCLSLKIAGSLQHQPLVFRTFVDQVDSEQLTLMVPSLRAVSDRKQELPFCLMGVYTQPEVITDTAMKRDSVTVKWNKKIFKEKATFNADFSIKRKAFKREAERQGKPNSPIVMMVNPHLLGVFLKHAEWARILTFLSNPEGHALQNTPSPQPKGGVQVDMMSSEKGDGKSKVSLRPCHFKIVYSPGQILQVQMSAEPEKGILKPRMDLLYIARNSSFCLKHTKDPVSALYRIPTQATRDKQFTCFDDYRDAWMPLLEMEAAYGAVHSNSEVVVEDVSLSIQPQENADSSSKAVYIGTFTLGVKFCDDRCIEIGGDICDGSSDKKSSKSANGYFCPLDYMCIRYRTDCPGTVVSRVKESALQEAVDKHCTWIGHAGIVQVKHVPDKKEAKDAKDHRTGRVHATFMLSPSSPQPPDRLMQNDERVTLEILPKTEVDRRTQHLLLCLDGCELARGVAYGAKLPKLDKDYARLGKKDENHEVRVGDLPPNNPPQRDAIVMALTHPVSVIQGPPGTGKTYTGIKLVYLFCKINRQLEAEGKGKKTVLFCGPSNKSVDLVARLLKRRLGPDCPSMIRMYGSAIEAKDYPIPGGRYVTTTGMRDVQSDGQLQDVSLHHVIREDGKPHAEDIAAFERHFKKYPKSINHEVLKKYYKLLNAASVEELRHYEVVLATCGAAGGPRLKSVPTFQVIIDECAMSPEPHSLVPIIATKAGQVVLIGDHKQLRPIITCRAAADLGLDQSLFERLYKQNSSKIPKVFLSTQYRMHPRICEFPTQTFYDGKLTTGPSRLWSGEPLSFWPKMMTGEKIPHLLVNVQGTEETLSVSTEEGNERSKSNDKEAEKVVEIFTYLKKEHSIDTYSIRVLTQYNAQRHLIDGKLKTLCEDRSQNVFDRYDKNKITVSTVVSSQGGEFDYVILSTVRSLPFYKIEPNPTLGWCRQNLGFITDRNQVNVALTRARRGLIIVGNVELLRCDKVWHDLVVRYERMGCVFNAEAFPPPPPPRERIPRR